MSVQYSYLAEPHVVLIRYFGRTTLRQQDKLRKVVIRDFGKGQMLDSVSDLRQLTSTTLTSLDRVARIKDFNSLLVNLKHPVKHALVANTPMTIGICRMYMGYAAGAPKLDLRLFNDLSAATSWVGLPGDGQAIFDQADWTEIAD